MLKDYSAGVMQCGPAPWVELCLQPVNVLSVLLFVYAATSFIHTLSQVITWYEEPLRSVRACVSCRAYAWAGLDLHP